MFPVHENSLRNAVGEKLFVQRGEGQITTFWAINKNRNFLTIAQGMVIWRRKEKKKKNRDEEGSVGRKKDRNEIKMNQQEAITKSLWSLKGNTAGKLEYRLQEATAHWHRPDNLILSVFIKTQVSIISQTVWDAWKDQFLFSSSVAPS